MKFKLRDTMRLFLAVIVIAVSAMPLRAEETGDAQWAGRVFDNLQYRTGSGGAENELLIKVGLGAIFNGRGFKARGKGEIPPIISDALPGTKAGPKTSPQDFDVRTQTQPAAAPAPTWARRQHKLELERLDEQVQERTQARRHMMGRDLDGVTQHGVRFLQEAFIALAGLAVAFAAWKIDISLLQGMWSTMFSNAFGSVAPEMMSSVKMLALQGAMAVAVTHYAYELLPKGAKKAVIFSLAAAAATSLALAGQMFGVEGVLQYGQHAVTGILNSGVLSPIPELGRLPSAAAQSPNLLVDKAIAVPGIITTFMLVSSGVAAHALTDSFQALRKIAYSVELTASDRHKIEAMDQRIDQQAGKVKVLEEQFPGLQQEIWPTEE